MSYADDVGRRLPRSRDRRERREPVPRRAPAASVSPRNQRFSFGGGVFFPRRFLRSRPCRTIPFILACALALAAASDLYRQAVEKFRARQYEAALNLASQAVAQQPNNPDYLHLHGLALAAVGRFQDADRSLLKAIELQPDRANFRHDYAMTLLRQGREKEALPMLERAVELAPDNLLSRLYLGRAYHNLNFSEKAFVQFEAVAKADSKFPTVHYHLAKIHLNSGRDDEALRELQIEVANFPQVPLARLELGELLLKRGDAGKALEHLQAVEKSAPPQAKLYFLMAKAHRQENRPATALEAAEKSVRLDPTDPAARYLLGRLYQETGQIDKARAEMAEFQRLSEAARQPD